MTREVSSDEFTTSSDYEYDLETTTSTAEYSTNETITDDLESDEETAESFEFVNVIIGLILVVVLTIAYFVGKYVKRHTGVYITREDAGEANAPDADTAVLHSRTGHLVEKKQEWFF